MDSSVWESSSALVMGCVKRAGSAGSGFLVHDALSAWHSPDEAEVEAVRLLFPFIPLSYPVAGSLCCAGCRESARKFENARRGKMKAAGLFLATYCCWSRGLAAKTHSSCFFRAHN